MVVLGSGVKGSGDGRKGLGASRKLNNQSRSDQESRGRPEVGRKCLLFTAKGLVRTKEYWLPVTVRLPWFVAEL